MILVGSVSYYYHFDFKNLQLQKLLYGHENAENVVVFFSVISTTHCDCMSYPQYSTIVDGIIYEKIVT